ncbi:MAG: MnmC family methyltransferase [Planctomycetota bacterium]|nr:MnmC family methyltransferase [Planctomycetota bacterium]
MAQPAILTGDGSPTLFHRTVGEHYHSLSGAHLEARQRFIEPCRVIRTARVRGQIRILDIGFGLGTNLGWAVHDIQRAAPGAAIEIVSLERDLLPGDQLKLFFRALPQARLSVMLKRLVEERRWIEEGLQLTLLVGDAEQLIDSLEGRFDAVFLDPFSPKLNPGPWRADFLRAVRNRMVEGGILSTYSSARRVRLSLLRSGWQIGCGPAVGMKSSGTLASAGSVQPPLPPLDAKLQRKLARQMCSGQEEDLDE